jgi:ribonuclease P protein component
VSRGAPGGSGAARPLGMPRDRRLKRRRLIRPLFQHDRPGVGRVSSGVIQLRWRLVPRAESGTDTPLQVGFAPGRRARTKVARNRLRRIMRESWRINQEALIDRMRSAPGRTLTVFALYRGPVAGSEAEVRRDLPAAMALLSDRISAEQGRTQDAS